ncbi:Peptidase family M48 [Solimonas aquatica]|uniref:Peptidase family M48 n=1 Tax=Solimonas aquatica TaxID=489703 RepID=A0A1H9EN87_9GAMM|nr:M48 family metallopeptidase [Solimonas aquatica]SEQ27085.1 Peptidase family M48 [Solimonas aquatica]
MKARSFLIVLASLGLAAACATSPTGRHQLRLVSDQKMATMGVTAFQELKTKTPLTQNPQTSAYVQCVARAITQETGGQWEVQVFESKEVNAFALPGGKIGVYTGLLAVAQTQDQLAAVLGHEVSHVLAGHSAARVSNEIATQFGVTLVSLGTGLPSEAVGAGAKYLLILPFSRGDESEADELGMQLMARAGFDPAQAVELWRNMEKQSSGAPPEFASTHPSHATRIADLQRELPQVQPLYAQARAAGKNPGCKSS